MILLLLLFHFQLHSFKFSIWKYKFVFEEKIGKIKPIQTKWHKEVSTYVLIIIEKGKQNIYIYVYIYIYIYIYKGREQPNQ